MQIAKYSAIQYNNCRKTDVQQIVQDSVDSVPETKIWFKSVHFRGCGLWRVDFDCILLKSVFDIYQLHLSIAFLISFLYSLTGCFPERDSSTEKLGDQYKQLSALEQLPNQFTTQVSAPTQYCTAPSSCQVLISYVSVTFILYPLSAIICILFENICLLF